MGRKSSCLCAITCNGPAIKKGSVTRRIPAGRQYPPIPVQGFGGRGRKVWQVFCRPGTIIFEFYEYRGTKLIGSRILSPYCYFINSTCGQRPCIEAKRRSGAPGLSPCSFLS